MLARTTDPIVAIATASGRGAVGIVRVSGARLAPLIDALCGRALKPREATYLPFRDKDGEPVDHGLAIHFPSPNSFTGEDVLELQAHGGAVVLQLLLARCLEAAAEPDPVTGRPRLPGLRVAEPGEFSQRAFLNGKIDLAQAEAIADLIDASTEAAARSAGRSLSGAFSREIHTLRDALIHLRMLVEATLDFPEEEIDFLQKADATGQLARLQSQLAAVQQRAKQGALLREGIKVVIAGQPNAGKSSLLNALAGAELAIVSAVAGTTRDVVSQTIQIHGVPLHVADTAGLRESSDEVEQIGVARAWGQIESADAVLFLHDLTRATLGRLRRGRRRDPGRPAPEAARERAGARRVEQAGRGARAALPGPGPGIALSAKTGLGIEALREQLAGHGRLAGRARGRVPGAGAPRAGAGAGGNPPGAGRQRTSGAGATARPAGRRTAAGAERLNEITGEFGADDLLGSSFRASASASKIATAAAKA
jgi:tRNA modification GTPase